MAFEYLQVWRLHNLPRNLCQCLVTLTGKCASSVSLFALFLWSCYRAPLGAVWCSLPHSPSPVVCACFSLSPLPWIPPPSHPCWQLWLLLTFTCPTSHSLWAWSPAQHHFSLTLSQKRKLSSVHSRKLLNCLNSSVLCFQDVSGYLGPQKPGLVNVRLFLSACRGSDMRELTETSEQSPDQFSAPH